MANLKNMEIKSRQERNEELNFRFKIIAPEPQIDSPHYHQDSLDRKFHGKGMESLLKPNTELFLK